MGATGWLAIRWLHVLAMALFVGGQMVLVVAIVPVLRGGHRDALRSIARRFGWASLAALGVLVATGSALAAHASRWDSGTLHVKLALVLAVIAMIVWHMRRPGAHAIEAVVFVISLAIVWLGLALAHGPLPFSARLAYPPVEWTPVGGVHMCQFARCRRERPFGIGDQESRSPVTEPHLA